MNEVSTVSRLPVRPVESGAQGRVDELADKLVPVEEEQLPQGVADLVATMIWRQRPLMGMGRGETFQRRAPDQGMDERSLQEPRIQSAVLDQLLHVQRLQVAVSQMGKSVMPIPTPTATPLPKSEVALPLLSAIERSAIQIDPVALDQPLPPVEPAAPDHPIETHPKTLPVAYGVTNIPSLALPVTVSAPAPASPPVPMLDLALEEAAAPTREFLQVPFNKGAAHGQVTITRLPGESIQNLVLSPSSSQVFEQLREPFEQVRDAHWRLNDHRDEQQHQGSRQSPDDEQEQPQETVP